MSMNQEPKCKHTTYDRIGTYGECVCCLKQQIEGLKSLNESLIKRLVKKRKAKK